MFSLQDHPFAVEAHFETSLVFTFAAPKDELSGLIPECLELDTFNEAWGFVAVAMVRTKQLRPKGFPRFFGNDFFLVGYRVFVRYTDTRGKRIRGLYILRSETDKPKMVFWGNIFTHYNYGQTDVVWNTENGLGTITSEQSDFAARYDESAGESSPLPEGSPFATWKEARRFAGPLPFTFTYTSETRKVVIIEGVRQNWHPAPVKVIDQHFSFIEGLDLGGLRLANAFIIHDVPYYWKRGRSETWGPR